MDYCLYKGETALIILDYTVNGEPLDEFQPDELEFSFGGIQYLLSDGGLIWDEGEQAFVLPLTQEQTFALPKACAYQLRVMKDGLVKPSATGYLLVGPSESSNVLTDGNGGEGVLA